MDQGLPLVPSEQSPSASGPGCLLIRPNKEESRYDPEKIARLVYKENIKDTVHTCVSRTSACLYVHGDMDMGVRG